MYSQTNIKGRVSQCIPCTWFFANSTTMLTDLTFNWFKLCEMMVYIPQLNRFRRVLSFLIHIIRLHAYISSMPWESRDNYVILHIFDTLPRLNFIVAACFGVTTLSWSLLCQPEIPSAYSKHRCRPASQQSCLAHSARMRHRQCKTIMSCIGSEDEVKIIRSVRYLIGDIPLDQALENSRHATNPGRSSTTPALKHTAWVCTLLLFAATQEVCNPSRWSPLGADQLERALNRESPRTVSAHHAVLHQSVSPKMSPVHASAKCFYTIVSEGADESVMWLVYLIPERLRIPVRLHFIVILHESQHFFALHNNLATHQKQQHGIPAQRWGRWGDLLACLVQGRSKRRRGS